MRLSACFGASIHIIEPAGFHIDDKRINRVAMDYIKYLEIQKHISSKRIILATTKSEVSYLNFSFRASDILLFGRESSGVPVNIHNICDNRIKIVMQNEIRSFNVANSCAIILSEAVRQINN